MCGICGWASKNDAIDNNILSRMCDALEHRGPDDSGLLVEGQIGIAMRRLSIIGLSSGHQPIHNEDKSAWIVFNGEIYNYLELRKELKDKGHNFYTDSDTEVIIHLYEEYGELASEKLRGMFTFAIIDIKEEKLVIARDRFGIKPLYYYWDKDSFIFASEIQSILVNPIVKPAIDLQAVDLFFTFGYIPASRTSFNNIKKLNPGCILTLKDNNISLKKYWSFSRNSSVVGSDKYYSLSKQIENFFEIFQNTIEQHLISEVPLGAFLSGGIDSSLVVGMMSQVSNLPVETFSIGYDQTGAEFDERKFARIVSKHFNTKHREFIIQPDIIEVLPQTVISFGEPVGNASILINYYLSQKVAQHVTVALSGLGGDELCAGYNRYLGIIAGDYYQKLPDLIKKGVSRLIERIPDSETGSHLPERLKRFVRAASLPAKDRYYNFICKFNDAQRNQLFTNEVKEQLNKENGYYIYSQCWQNNAQLDLLHKLMKIDIETYMVDDLLTLTDKVSMAHSLEVRVPFLDHKLAEFLWNVSTDLKLYKPPKFTTKYFLKKAAEQILPKEVIYRPKKGFSMPLTVWFRGPLKPYVEKMLSETSLRKTGLFNVKFVSQLLAEHYSRKANHDEKIFALLSFMLWHNYYFDQKK